jgi:dienelactone hydrolase
MALRPRLTAILALLVASTCLAAEDPPLADFFRAEVRRIAERPLDGIDSAEGWKARRPELQRRLLEMLGLWPLPEKADLRVRQTGIVERPEFVVEKLLYQSLPGLYVTANLYRPKDAAGPLPAILYVCGHGKVEKDGVIYGNKTHYQHHAEWYAANGYVCLVVDTLQLGEVPGLHHGTYREGLWGWYGVGYTPAGIEAWNGVQAIDYLCSRPDVDPKRIGVTGRSGGGATSWWLGAIDDRLAAVIPVAGITDLGDHVVGGDFAGPHAAHGVVEGHCDCMYFVNTYRWDYTTLAALVAPKPLLVENTDADPIFPEAGVRRIYETLKTVYGWYGSEDRLGLVIGVGGHADTVELRHPSFAFMEKWLKGKDVAVAEIQEPDHRIPVEELKVLPVGETLPDSRNATIHERFRERAEAPPVPGSTDEWERLRDGWMERIRRDVFAGWPATGEAGPLNVEKALDVTRGGLRLRAYDFDSQLGVRLRFWILSDPKAERPDRIELTVADAGEWSRDEVWLRSFEEGEGDPEEAPPSPEWLSTARRGGASALVAVRGVGPTAWPEEKDRQIRRRFYLLGETLDGMRAWDVRRTLAAFDDVEGMRGVPVGLGGTRGAAAIALWAAVFEPRVDAVRLTDPTLDGESRPVFLNLDRILGMPQAVALLYPRPVRLVTPDRAAWGWLEAAGKALSPEDPWPTIQQDPGDESGSE